MPRNPSRRSPASTIFNHLSEEERLDQACEILALGVLRLAEKRGLLKHQIDSGSQIDEGEKEAV